MRLISNYQLVNKFIYYFSIVLLICSYPDSTIAQNINQRLRTANALANSYQYDRALTLYEQIYNSDNRNLSAIIGIKNCLIGLQDYNRLITFLGDVLKSQPAQSPLYVDLGEAYFLNDQRDKAFEVWLAHLEHNRDNPGVYRLVAMAMIRQRLYHEAIDVYQKAIDRLKNQDMLHIDIANLYKIQLDYEKASDHFLQYYQKQPEQIAFIQQQLLSLTDKGQDIIPVVTAINSFLKKHPEQDNIREILAGLYLKNKDYDQAFSIYLSLENEKSKGIYIQKFALEAFANHAYSKAIQGFKHIIQNYPDSPLINQTYYNLGRSYASYAYSMGNNEEAAQNMQLAVTIYNNIVDSNQKSPLALNAYINLADIYFKFYFDLDKAIVNYQNYLQYIKQGKTRDLVLVLLGDTYLTKNQTKLALETYQLVKNGEYLNTAKFKEAELYFYIAGFKKAEQLFSQLLSQLKTDDPLMNNVLTRWTILKTFKEDSTSLSQYAQADLLKFQKKYAQAAKEFNELSLTNKNWCVQAGINASKLYSQLGNYEESEAILIRVKNDNPQDKDIDEIIFLLAETEENLKKPDSALDLYNQLLTHYPNSLLTHKAREKARLLTIELNKEQS